MQLKQQSSTTATDSYPLEPTLNRDMEKSLLLVNKITCYHIQIYDSHFPAKVALLINFLLIFIFSIFPFFCMIISTLVWNKIIAALRATQASFIDFC